MLNVRRAEDAKVTIGPGWWSGTRTGDSVALVARSLRARVSRTGNASTLPSGEAVFQIACLMCIVFHEAFHRRSGPTLTCLHITSATDQSQLDLLVGCRKTQETRSGVFVVFRDRDTVVTRLVLICGEITHMERLGSNRFEFRS